MDAKTSSDKLRAISDAIKVEGPQMLNAISANTGEALKVIGETEIALDKLKAGGLKKAISELRNASKDMDTLSTQMGLVGHVGTALLVVGLLLSAWCFLNSLSVLILTRSNVANNPEASVT
jgi:hypothetical protein